MTPRTDARRRPSNRRSRAAWPCGALVALALLTGCAKEELYSKLSEQQANEMVAVLQGEGIEAEKQAQDGGFVVLTPSAAFPRAVRSLSARGLPRENYDSMGGIFKKEGFVSTPLEERARLLHAMSQEISNTLSSIDGVVTARVHLVIPEKHPLLDSVRPSAAAVFIKHRPDRDLASQTTLIKALVVNSIEGLSYDNVTVALFPAEGVPSDTRRAAPLPGAAARADLASSAPLVRPLLLGTGAGGAALAGGGLLWWRRRAAAAPAALSAAPVPIAPASRQPKVAFEAALQRRAADAS
jgi:type III secretion protein J